MRAVIIPLALAASIASAHAQSVPALAIDDLGPDSVMTVRLSDRPPGSTWSLENSLDGRGWDPVQPGGVPVRFSLGADTAIFSVAGSARYFRAVATEGPTTSTLYDVGILRDFHLEFSQADWSDQLNANYEAGTNIPADLIVEGVRYSNVGVRYKGETSFEFILNSPKKSFAIEIDDADPELRLLGFRTLNLNNAFADPSFMREVLYGNASAEYYPSPRANFVRLFVNGAYFGIYVNAQQENRDLLEAWFDDTGGDRWRAGVGQIRVTEGQFDFGGSLRWEGPERTDYDGYELKSGGEEDAAWSSLLLAINALNNTPEKDLPGLIDSVFAVDRWLWTLALENIYLDEDSYLFKAGDYLLYRDPATGRFHPVQRDGNESFDISRTTSRGALNGENLPLARPLSTVLLDIPEYRQRYLAHLRTVLERTFTVENIGSRVDAYAVLIRGHVEADPIKLHSLQDFDGDTAGDDANLKEFVENRRAFLLADAEVDVPSPQITGVSLGASPVASMPTPVMAQFDESSVQVRGAVLFHTTNDPNREFASLPMTDSGGGSFTADIPALPVATTVFYYVEGEADDLPGTRAYFPVLAEAHPLSFRVEAPVNGTPPVVINEFMASNDTTLADPQGEFDDWIELRNVSGAELDVGGMYLSDNPDNVLKWRIPDDTIVPTDGYLVVWADEDGQATPGLHANFKLSADGEVLFLSDTDAAGNALLDSVSFGLQATDVSTGRPASDPDVFAPMSPTPGSANSG